MKFQNPSMYGSKDMACIKKRDGRTDNPKAICPPTLEKVGGHIAFSVIMPPTLEKFGGIMTLSQIIENT